MQDRRAVVLTARSFRRFRCRAWGATPTVAAATPHLGCAGERFAKMFDSPPVPSVVAHRQRGCQGVGLTEGGTLRTIGPVLLAIGLLLGVAVVVRGTSQVDGCGTAVAPSVFGRFQRETSDPAVLAMCSDLVRDRRLEVGIETFLAVVATGCGAVMVVRARREQLPADPFST